MSSKNGGDMKKNIQNEKEFANNVYFSIKAATVPEGRHRLSQTKIISESKTCCQDASLENSSEEEK